MTQFILLPSQNIWEKYTSFTLAGDMTTPTILPIYDWLNEMLVEFFFCIN